MGHLDFLGGWGSRVWVGACIFLYGVWRGCHFVEGDWFIKSAIIFVCLCVHACRSVRGISAGVCDAMGAGLQSCLQGVVVMVFTF